MGYACRTLSGFCAAVGVVFFVLARQNPPPRPGIAPPPSPPVTAVTVTAESGGGTSGSPPLAQPKAIEWGIFRVPASRAMVLYWLAVGNSYMNMAQWAPTYFQVKFLSTPAEVCTPLTPAVYP